MPLPAPPRQLLRTALPLLLPLLLAGCAGGAVGNLASAALQMAGVARSPPAPPDAQQPPRLVSIRLHAAQRLNTDAAGRPLALVARIYKLRQSAAFEQARYDSFLDARREQAALGADLVEVKEVLLVPGQRYEVQEKISKEASFIGVVALFRAPAAQHWRATFAAADAERAGITVGLHACALSVGGTQGAMAPLSALRCQ
ncbi:type VI secretion system lipoprotein TssJ [Janthinobacterium sp.]|uniref:type VI secretion system lipoprotein TssJ n=1 Tax=Janthinobacterium sp. TaxID=1871054 RepID=UPI0025C27DBA|nr:type VI secretion system lipoprotein TssJ [Janthinobacterium sp.]NBV19615.1 type VI secretion system lipoprotein TssJ [Janthinobacterium sp.]